MILLRELAPGRWDRGREQSDRPGRAAGRAEALSGQASRSVLMLVSSSVCCWSPAHLLAYWRGQMQPGRPDGRPCLVPRDCATCGAVSQSVRLSVGVSVCLLGSCLVGALDPVLAGRLAGWQPGRLAGWQTGRPHLLPCGCAGCGARSQSSSHEDSR